MSLYSVIFNRHEKFSSDAAVSSEPTETSVVVAPLHQADIATVEADSPADAEHAVRATYNGSTSFVHVVDHENVVTAPFEDEQAKAREAVDKQTAEQEAAEQETVDEPVDENPADSTPAEKVAENTKQEPVPVTVENQPVETV